MVRFFPNANYKFIELRKYSYIATVLAFVLGIGVALFFQASKGSWLNYGVDFAGGTLLQLRFTQPTTAGELRPIIEARVPGTEITNFGDQNEFLVRTPKFTAGNRSASDEAVAALRAQFGNNFQVGRTEAVSAKVGRELTRNAIIAVLLSFAATLIYLAFRFEWRFGLAAVIATMHDTLITLLIIAAFRMEVSLTTVAAVLTIVGYSLNDTIVIFDRIRENLKKTARKHVDLRELMNRSINETLPRTTLTASTTLATLLSLAIFGGAILREFAVILIVGIVLGTYSSIFIASPVLYEIEKRWGDKSGHKPVERQTRIAL
ncbi:MAG TPA: protein translocase subunit SecF [Vicinamibacterales bacterium]|nr:protein translocase subunit SecF [Vicinamibacterales bacterium]